MLPTPTPLAKLTKSVYEALDDGLKRRRQVKVYQENDYDDQVLQIGIRLLTLHENSITKETHFMQGRQEPTMQDIYPFSYVQHPSAPLQWTLPDLYTVVQATLLHVAQVQHCPGE